MEKIGVDLHGCLTKDKEGFIKFLMDKFTESGKQKFFIISGGRDKKIIEKELDKLNIFRGIHYEDIICMVDYLINKGVSFFTDEKGNPWCKPDTWWKAKAEICKEYDIRLMIDDQVKYGEHFEKNKFILYKDFIKRVTKHIRK